MDKIYKATSFSFGSTYLAHIVPDHWRGAEECLTTRHFPGSPRDPHSSCGTIAAGSTTFLTPGALTDSSIGLRTCWKYASTAQLAAKRCSCISSCFLQHRSQALQILLCSRRSAVTLQWQKFLAAEHFSAHSGARCCSEEGGFLILPTFLALATRWRWCDISRNPFGNSAWDLLNRNFPCEPQMKKGHVCFFLPW